MFNQKIKKNISEYKKLKVLFLCFTMFFIFLLPNITWAYQMGTRDAQLTDDQRATNQATTQWLVIDQRRKEVEAGVADGTIPAQEGNAVLAEISTQLENINRAVERLEQEQIDSYRLEVKNEPLKIATVTFPDIKFDCGIIRPKLDCYAAYISYNFFLVISAHLMRLSGFFFDFILQHTVVKMSAYLFNSASGLGAIDMAWTIIRDFVNIAFIFLILYIAIKTIIKGSGDTSKQITQIIVVALLINFSLFFTKFAIDIGNMASLSLYNTIVEDVKKDSTGPETTISTAIITKTGVTTVFAAGSTLAAASGPKPVMNYTAIAKQSFMGSILLGTVSFVLFAVAFMLLTRFIVLVFVLMTSAAAFAGYLLPKTKSMITDKWVSALINQTMFPAVFLLFLLVSLRVYTNVNATINRDGVNDFKSAAESVSPEHLFSFILVILLILGSLKIAKSMSSSSGSFVSSKIGAIAGMGIGAAVGTGAFLGRRTIGAGASALAGRVSENNPLGRVTKKGLDKIGNSSLDIRNSKKMAGVMTKTLGAAGVTNIGNGGGQGGYGKIRKEKDQKDKGVYDGLGKTTRKEEKELIKETTIKDEATKELRKESASLAFIQKRNKEKVEADPVIRNLKEFLEKAEAKGNEPQAKKIRGQLEYARESKLKQINNADEEYNAAVSSLTDLTSKINAAAKKIARIQGKSTDAEGNEVKSETGKSAGQERQEKFVKDKKSFLWGTSFSTPQGTNDFIHNVRLEAAKKSTRTEEEKEQERVMKALTAQLASSSPAPASPTPAPSA